MLRTRQLCLTTTALAFAALFAMPHAGRAQTVAIDNDDIGGVVRGPNGPEAGVWVIAETRDLATRFTKSVVTDDQGRYVLPDLPKANYTVWVRGYGLVDSPSCRARPARSSISMRCRRRMRPRQQNTIRRSTGTPCSKCQTGANSPAPGRKATACRPI